MDKPTITDKTRLLIDKKLCLPQMKIEIRKPDYSKVNHGKNVCIVTFNNGTKWMPSYKEIAMIMVALDDVEENSWETR